MNGRASDKSMKSESIIRDDWCPCLCVFITFDDTLKKKIQNNAGLILYFKIRRFHLKRPSSLLLKWSGQLE